MTTFISCDNSEEYVYKDRPKMQPVSNRSYSIRNLVADAKVDILWVVDNSGSMGSIQQNIVTNSAYFMDEFIKNNIMQWKMGVMSTDESEAPYLGFSSPFDYNTPDPVPIFQNAIDLLGTTGDYNEYVFHNVLRARTNPSLSKFFRNDAHMAIIMVTDEEEQSEYGHGAQYESMAFINSLKKLMGSNKILRFYGAFNFTDLQDCTSMMAEYAGSPFEVVIDQTQGLHMSACTKNFGTQLAEIGKDILSIVDTPQILLNELPIIETIKVMFENVELPGGPRGFGGLWYYDEIYNKIVFYSLDFIPDNLPDPQIKILFDIDDGYNRDEIE
jgi:hypothetical protein